LAEAKIYIEELIKAGSKNPKLHLFLASYYSQKGNIKRAISEYEIYLKKEPNNEPALYNLGVLYYQTKNYEKAIYYFQKTIVLKSK